MMLQKKVRKITIGNPIQPVAIADGTDSRMIAAANTVMTRMSGTQTISAASPYARL